jgi:hypothetical protein
MGSKGLSAVIHLKRAALLRRERPAMRKDLIFGTPQRHDFRLSHTGIGWSVSLLKGKS